MQLWRENWSCYACQILRSDETVLEDARLIRSEVERCRRILERMTDGESAEPMGEKSPQQGPSTRPPYASHRAIPRVALKVARKSLLPMKHLPRYLPEQATSEQQSLAALIQNALDANFDQRPILITATGTDSVLGYRAFATTGMVCRQTSQCRILEPFFTTKEPGKGA